METKKVSRKALANGIRELLSAQRSQARKDKAKEIEDIMELDERVLVLRSLKEIHPFLAKEFKHTIKDLKDSESSKIVQEMPSSWISNDEIAIIRARLELMTDNELRGLTLEELTSLVKEQ
jgi:hypothetical protein